MTGSAADVSPNVEAYRALIEYVVASTEVVGTAVMIVGGAVVLLRAARPMVHRAAAERPYEVLRRDFGRVLLVGLEILIVADIVRTIVSTDLNAVAVLGAVVLIRTVLSLSIAIEIGGALPWRRADKPVLRPEP